MKNDPFDNNALFGPLAIIRHWRIKFFEHYFCILIIIFLAITCITTYNGYRKSAVYAAAIAEVINLQGHFNQYYYAVHGEWPHDEKQAQEFALTTCLSYPADYHYNEVPGIIRDGAITIIITKDIQLPNGKITMRPVVSAGYPLGPVHYVSGNKNNEPGWLISGTNHTDIEEKYLLKQILK
ncbi:MAG: hypothetical protein OEM02_13230 [Desulfobulbaceae bacterium]|nr:hypothetical protein [Desulfobulbaceae bacterium]